MRTCNSIVVSLFLLALLLTGAGGGMKEAASAGASAAPDAKNGSEAQEVLRGTMRMAHRQVGNLPTKYR
jgi:hypothetical protein